MLQVIGTLFEQHSSPVKSACSWVLEPLVSSPLTLVLVFARTAILLSDFRELTLSGASSHVVRVETHELRVRVPLDLHIGSHISEFKFTFAAIRALGRVESVRLLPVQHLVSTEVADVVLAATAAQHVVEVTQTHWAVELELVSRLSVLGEKVAALHILHLVATLNHHIALFLLLSRCVVLLSLIRLRTSWWDQFCTSPFKLLDLPLLVLSEISGSCSLSSSILRPWIKLSWSPTLLSISHLIFRMYFIW